MKPPTDTAVNNLEMDETIVAMAMEIHDGEMMPTATTVLTTNSPTQRHKTITVIHSDVAKWTIGRLQNKENETMMTKTIIGAKMVQLHRNPNLMRPTTANNQHTQISKLIVI